MRTTRFMAILLGAGAFVGVGAIAASAVASDAWEVGSAPSGVIWTTPDAWEIGSTPTTDPNDW